SMNCCVRTTLSHLYMHTLPLPHLYFFFLMIRRPPRSTLFPTRRSSDLIEDELHLHRRHRLDGRLDLRRERRELVVHEEHRVVARSEEHTSELQSRGHLVCRLLLEKKKIEV